MYAPFFGLEHPPFSIAPDPRYLFMSERHREALAHLLYGLNAGGGFVLLTGEVGTGKTTVCRCFLEQIPDSCNVAYIFNPKLTVPELLRSICDEFGVPHSPATPGAETVKDCIDPLNDFLLRAHAAGRSSVLIIDEAQNLARDVLEQLRLLTNLETSEKKLLQIILIGQPELRTLVAHPKLEQLAQRVIARYHLAALSRAETAQYIAHRLSVAGLRGPLPFDRRALAQVHAITQGVPRRINVLCDRALLGAYSRGERQVRGATLRQAAREVFGSGGPARGAGAQRRWLAGGAGLLAGAGATLAAVWALGLVTWPAGVASPDATATAAATAASAPASVAAPAGAAAAKPAAAPAAPTLAQFLQAQPEPALAEAAAWRTLARAWQAEVAPDAPDACAALAGQGLRCFRSRRASLSLLRLIDRPVLLTLQPPGGGPEQVVVLQALQGDAAQLAGADGATRSVPLAELAPLWHGDIATLWKAPANLPASGDLMAGSAAAAWLDRQLARASGTAVPERPLSAAARRARIHQFQLAQGLTPDGQAGPLTLMQLNRATGVQEPRLERGAS
ncbi:MAG TPA: peptidoglycan-binding protein [Comamonadaceae bacterium]|uniref:AAA family ATPase n=1 Tax=Pulveribacter sp. TaxID=2678893 RepID=UPI000ED7C7AA|nr:AAA family ATPase [Pulveribacter sp.]HCL85099.1 peptidoglycan-binding protein [Comamonadaceae bacterium]